MASVEDVKKAVMNELKNNKDSNMWVNEIHRRVIKNGVSCSLPTVIKALDELEKDGVVTIKKIGNVKMVVINEKI